MELKIGDYVRTINGKIWIITSQKAISGHKKDIIKSSPRIIDLIEVGDYVNGWRVNRIEKEDGGIFFTIGNITSFISKNETDPYLTRDHNDENRICKIESIVTKEMYASVEYRVETN